jgi:hypothetical protein
MPPYWGLGFIMFVVYWTTIHASILGAGFYNVCSLLDDHTCLHIGAGFYNVCSLLDDHTCLHIGGWVL